MTAAEFFALPFMLLASLVVMAIGLLVVGFVVMLLSELWDRIASWWNPCYSRHDWVDVPGRPENWNPNLDWEQKCKRCGAGW
jgi:hypothetical protein